MGLDLQASFCACDIVWSSPLRMLAASPSRMDQSRTSGVWIEREFDSERMTRPLQILGRNSAVRACPEPLNDEVFAEH